MAEAAPAFANDSTAPAADPSPDRSARWRFWLNIGVNTVLFKVAWWVCVLGGAWGVPWAGVAMTLPALPIHAWLVGDWRKETVIILASGLYGYTFDSLLVVSGLMRFAESAQLLGPSPLWMVMLWLGFGATVRTALRFLFARPVIAIVSGAIVGPLSYRGGETLAAVWIEKSMTTTVLIGAQWVGAMVMLSVLLKWTDSWPERATHQTPA